MSKDKELLVINGVELQIAPSDIIVSENKNPEIVPMIRGKRSFVYNSKFAKGTIQIMLPFDITNEADRLKLISLCTYMDLYPFIFVKSDTLAKYTHHGYDAIFDYQIYGVRQYTLETSSNLNGVFFLTLEIIYFNYIPFASKIFFYNIESKTVNNISVSSGAKTKESTKLKLAETSIENSAFFAEFFRNEINTRRVNVEEFISSKGFNFVGMKYPKFSDKKTENSERVVYTKLKKDQPSVLSSYGKENTPLEAGEAFIDWIYITEAGSPEINNINLNNSAIQTLAITKRNNIAEQQLTAYVHPVLQYMGKGQVDLSLQLASDRNTNTIIESIKTAFSELDSNYVANKQLTSLNVMKVESLLTLISPAFGFTKAAEKNSLSAQNQGVEITEFYLIETDNRDMLKNAQYNSARVAEVFDFDKVTEAIRKAYAYAIELDQQPKQNNKKESNESKIPDTQLDIIKQIEKKYELPEGMLYGVYGAETNFGTYKTPENRSLKGAQGPFQIILSTGYGLGLTDSPTIPNRATDRRFDFAAAADASGKYLGQMFKKFKDVRLAIAAYNAGPGVVSKLGFDVLSPSRVSAAGFKGEALQHNTKATKYMQQFREGNYATSINNRVTGFGITGFSTERSDIKDLLINLSDKLYTDFYTDGALDKISAFIGKSIVSNAEKFNILASFIDQAKALKENPKTSAIITREFEQGYIDLTKLASNGNQLAKAAVSVATSDMNSFTESLDQEFKDEAIPDLNFKEHLSKNFLESVGFDPNKLRYITPFFFLAQEAYFNDDIVDNAYSGIASTITARQGNNTALADEKEALLKGVKASDNATVLENVGFVNEPTDFSDVNLANEKINIGNTKTTLDDIVQGNVYPQQEGDLDPFGVSDIVSAQAVSLKSYFKHGINLAFPVIKVYIVDADENSIGENISGPQQHLYYELNGIIEASITTSDDENPVDVFTMLIANPGNVYTDKHVLFDKFKPTTDYSKLGTEDQNRILLNSIMLKPGVRLQVRGGYGNNPNDMPVMFNGIITESGGESVLQIVAEGFGRELEMYKHGDDPNANGFFMNASTKAILANALNYPEIEHFGIFRFLPGLETDPESKRLVTTANGFFNTFKTTNKYTNIWLNQIQETDATFNSNFINFKNLFDTASNAYYEYPIFKATPWSMLKEMEYRHPGVLSKPVIYEDRASYFFGLKEQLYVYKDINSRITDDTIEGNALYQKIKRSRFKPVCELHAAVSEQNIIYNKIKLSDDFATVINVQYADLSDRKKNDFDNFVVKIDDNLRPSSHREMDMSMPGLNDKVTAVRYGSVGIRREAERMYDGELVLIGNPSIKANDYIYINDKFRNMKGIIKVREAVHNWSMDTGFTTVITPGLHIDTTYKEYPTQPIINFLGAGLGIITEVASQKAIDASKNNPRNEQYSFLLQNPVKLDKDLINNTSFAALKTGSLLGFGAVVIRPFVKTKLAETISSLTNKGLSFIGRGAITAGGLASAIVVGAVALIGWNIYASTAESLKARQPVRIYPLTQNDIPYVAGIYGYEENGIYDSFARNIESTRKDASFIISTITSGIFK